MKKPALTSSQELSHSQYKALTLTEGLFIQVVRDSPSQLGYPDLTDLCPFGRAVTLRWREVRWGQSWGFYTLPPLQAHGVAPTPVTNPPLAFRAPFL